MLRVSVLLAAVVVTVAAYWLPGALDGRADSTGGDRPATPPAAAGGATASPAPPAGSPSGVPSAPPSTTAATPSGQPGGQPTVPGTTATPPGRSYANTAAFTGISDGAAVDHCERVSGRSSVAPTKTLLTAHRRTSPSDGTYYFFYVDGAQNGNTPSTWTTRIWFGSSADGHLYTVYLLIMDVEEARRFWGGNKVANGSYADAAAIPPSAVVADELRVEQRGLADC
ncbi:hypothetical protein [Virgisporangium ochraceum]|nr:hypothetical protein [Virgisporangium ochraceum]